MPKPSIHRKTHCLREQIIKRHVESCRIPSPPPYSEKGKGTILFKQPYTYLPPGSYCEFSNRSELLPSGEAAAPFRLTATFPASPLGSLQCALKAKFANFAESGGGERKGSCEGMCV